MISSPERFYSRQSTIYVVRSARCPSKFFLQNYVVTTIVKAYAFLVF